MLVLDPDCRAGLTALFLAHRPSMATTPDAAGGGPRGMWTTLPPSLTPEARPWRRRAAGVVVPWPIGPAPRAAALAEAAALTASAALTSTLGA